MKKLSLISAVSACALGTAAHAVTIDLLAFEEDSRTALVANLSDVSAEGFEGIGAAGGEREIATGTTLSTNVGEFSSLGGVATGGTFRSLAGNTGTNVAVRSGNVFGRSNTEASGSYFLDSNDTFGIGWDVSNNGALFDRIIFTVTDASEFGYLRITAGDTSVEQRLDARFVNGSSSLVDISLESAVRAFRVELANYAEPGGLRALGDGFSVDNITVGLSSLSSVPLPAGLPLLAAGLGAFGLMRRKR